MRLSVGSGLLAMVLLLSGCCLFMEPTPPPQANDCEVSLKSSSTVALEDVWVHQEGDQLVIEGTLHPRSFIQKAVGHVDVRITDTKGNLLKVLKIAPENPVFEKTKGRVSPFTVSFDLVVAPDATAYLEAHDGDVESCNRLMK